MKMPDWARGYTYYFWNHQKEAEDSETTLRNMKAEQYLEMRRLERENRGQWISIIVLAGLTSGMFLMLLFGFNFIQELLR